MDCMSPLREHASGLVEVYFVEFIALALELEGCSDAEHDLDGAGNPAIWGAATIGGAAIGSLASVYL